jgi:hypothetical protein
VRPSKGLFALGQLEHELEELLGVPVDLVTFDSRRPEVSAQAERGDPPMTRHDNCRLGDILEAIRVIREHLRQGDLNESLVFDAVRLWIVEIGEAVGRSMLLGHRDLYTQPRPWGEDPVGWTSVDLECCGQACGSNRPTCRWKPPGTRRRRGGSPAFARSCCAVPTSPGGANRYRGQPT